LGTIELEAVEKWFGDVPVIRGVDLTVKEGAFAVFVGPSGCGKSTLLRLVAGLEEVSRGAIRIDGRDVTELAPAARRLAMVFQSYALYPHMSARDNLAFALKMAREPRAEIDRRVAEAARILKLEALLGRKPKELSGGQRQRVAIGRAIVRQPVAFLFDEPLSNLDAALRVEMRFELSKLHRELGATMVYVTHDQTEAMTLADEIVVLNEGRVEQVGEPLALYERPANLFVAQFIGSPRMNLLACAASGERAVRLSGGGDVALAHPAAGAATLGIRPEHLKLAPPGEGAVEGRVELAEHLGADSFLHVDAGPLGILIVRAPPGALHRAGATVGLAFPPERCHLFDAAGNALQAGRP
jgi:multiple sugar transport system ATP-binding protein